MKSNLRSHRELKISFFFFCWLDYVHEKVFQKKVFFQSKVVRRIEGTGGQYKINVMTDRFVTVFATTWSQ